MSTKKAHHNSRLPLARLLRPFQLFIEAEASGGILLLASIILALIWANSPWAELYLELKEVHLSLGWGSYSLSLTLLEWINDGLMTVFFLVVGLEIKRELLVGELSSRKEATLPLVAALGGMLVPAALYLSLNRGGSGAAGWGIPMATDIAFAVGILTLLGSRAPLALKVFLTALAIFDDIGAVLVIAFFYTADLSLPALAAAGFIFALMLLAGRLGLRHIGPYLLMGAGLWGALLASGVHATLAGILLALVIPAKVKVDVPEFIATGRGLLRQFDATGGDSNDVLANEQRQAVLRELSAASRNMEAPLLKLERWLLPWTSYAIVPLFAVANAGIAAPANFFASLGDPVTLGIIGGLVLGKQIGITLFSWLAVRSGCGCLPPQVSWRQLYGVGWLAGIGFTMSLFIGNLAFEDAALLTQAKIGILAASLLAGVVGLVVLGTTRPASSR